MTTTLRAGVTRLPTVAGAVQAVAIAHPPEEGEQWTGGATGALPHNG
ncbi:MAG: hypothetical protein WA317_01420 [Mycobacterium sp.]